MAVAWSELRDEQDLCQVGIELSVAKKQTGLLCTSAPALSRCLAASWMLNPNCRPPADQGPSALQTTSEASSSMVAFQRKPNSSSKLAVITGTFG